MILSIDIPDVINRKLEAAKRKTGMSKSLIAREILKAHFDHLKSEVKKVA